MDAIKKVEASVDSKLPNIKQQLSDERELPDKLVESVLNALEQTPPAAAEKAKV